MLFIPFLLFEIRPYINFSIKKIIFWIEYVIVDNFESFLELISMQLMKFVSKTFYWNFKKGSNKDLFRVAISS